MRESVMAVPRKIAAEAMVRRGSEDPRAGGAKGQGMESIKRGKPIETGPGHGKGRASEGEVEGRGVLPFKRTSCDGGENPRNRGARMGSIVEQVVRLGVGREAPWCLAAVQTRRRVRSKRCREASTLMAEDGTVSHAATSMHGQGKGRCSRNEMKPAGSPSKEESSALPHRAIRETTREMRAKTS